MTDAYDQDWERVSIKMAQHDITTRGVAAAKSATPTVRVWRADALRSAETGSAAPPRTSTSSRSTSPPAAVISGTLQVKTVKITVVVRPEDALAVVPAAGPAAITVRTEDGRTFQAALNSKTVRKVQAAIREAGPDHVAVVLQAKLGSGNTLEEAGLSAQPKGPRS
jgi:hypothetical protein